MSDEKLSANSLIDANTSRAKFSGHGNAKGAAGHVQDGGDPESEFLSTAGQSTVVNPHEDGYGEIRIGAAWENITIEETTSRAARFFKKIKRRSGVDIDLGCLYETTDGERGCIQAFGDMMGDLDVSPFISLSGDERTGDTVGDDEILHINGKKWPHIKRVLVYAYIYDGAPNWSMIRPQIQITIPGEHPMVVLPDVGEKTLCVCAIAMMENIRNGIRLTNHSEYFPGHAEMDRAFGFGIEWTDGQK